MFSEYDVELFRCYNDMRLCQEYFKTDSALSGEIIPQGIIKIQHVFRFNFLDKGHADADASPRKLFLGGKMYSLGHSFRSALRLFFLFSPFLKRRYFRPFLKSDASPPLSRRRQRASLRVLRRARKRRHSQQPPSTPPPHPPVDAPSLLRIQPLSSRRRPPRSLRQTPPLLS